MESLLSYPAGKCRVAYVRVCVVYRPKGVLLMPEKHDFVDHQGASAFGLFAMFMPVMHVLSSYEAHNTAGCREPDRKVGRCKCPQQHEALKLWQRCVAAFTVDATRMPLPTDVISLAQQSQRKTQVRFSSSAKGVISVILFRTISRRPRFFSLASGVISAMQLLAR